MTEEGKDQSLRRKARGEEGDGKGRGLAVTEVSTPLLAACARTFICRTIVDGAGRPMRPNLPAVSAPARMGQSLFGWLKLHLLALIFLLKFLNFS